MTLATFINNHQVGDDQLQMPEYDTHCIVHVPNHIQYLHRLVDTSALGTPPRSHIKKTVLFMLDGFGYKQWHEQKSRVPLLQRFADQGTVTMVTSMFPSSTAPSTAALSTGLTTQQHGLLEWVLFEPKSEELIVTLPFTTLEAGVRDSLVGTLEPSILLAAPTLFEQLSQGGVQSYSLIDAKYAQSTYSSLAYAGSDIMAHTDLESLFTNLEATLRKDEQMHINVYWDRIDSAGHSFGPNSPEYAEQVELFFNRMNACAQNPEFALTAENTEFLIVADHGQITTDPSQTIWLDQVPGLSDYLATSSAGTSILPWGLQRDVFLKIAPHKLDNAMELLKTHLGASAIVLRSQEAYSAGLFGAGATHPDFIERIGDIVIIASGQNTIWYRHTSVETFTYKGMHGGLSPDEVQIAFAQSTLDQLINK